LKVRHERCPDQSLKKEKIDNRESGLGLLRRLTLLDSTFLVVGGVLGSGIFMTTGLIGVRLPSPALILAVFFAGGLVTLSGALAFAELGAMYPQAGGQYVYLREAYGAPAGFFFGWVFFWVIQCGGIAALASAFADYAGVFFGRSFDRRLFLVGTGGLHWSLTGGQLAAVASILLLNFINYFGIKAGTAVQNFLTVVRLACVVLFVGGAAWFIVHRPSEMAWPSLFTGAHSFTLAGFGLAMVAVFWAYDGWYSVNCTAEEVKNPKRNIPLSLILGTLTIILIYLLLNVVYFLVLPLGRIMGVERIGEAAAVQLFGPKGGLIMSGLIALTIFGCLSATMIYGPRVFYAMSRDGLFFSSLKEVHPRFRVPTKAIAGQALWSSLLCLSGKFQALIEYDVFALVLFFAASGLAVIVLRRRQPDRERPYRAWGYPVLPLLFVVINLGVFVNRIIAQPKACLAGLAILLLGWPGYAYWKAKRAKDPSLGKG
jgi:APA family basic amino acid/polyamine antiporter